MAKEKLVAKLSFDDGSKLGLNGKAVDYKVGEEYVGDAKSLAHAKKSGLVCSESELKASKEALNEKDKAVLVLEEKLAESKKALAAAEQAVANLAQENADLKARIEPNK